MRLTDVPIVKDIARLKIRPSEAYTFWNHYFKGFGPTFRDLTGEDATNDITSSLPECLSRMSTKTRNRMVIKLTGWPRIGFIKKLFPDAKFIHIVRDGRAVACSMLKVGFWNGWHGPSNWRWGPLSDELYNEWTASKYSFVVLAGLQWRLLMDAVEKGKNEVEVNDFLQIKYEDFCKDPAQIFETILSFSKLSFPPAFRRHIMKMNIQSANDKWKRDLTEKQQRLLESCIKDHLRRYGYL